MRVEIKQALAEFDKKQQELSKSPEFRGLDAEKIIAIVKEQTRSDYERIVNQSRHE